MIVVVVSRAVRENGDDLRVDAEFLCDTGGLSCEEMFVCCVA